MAIEYVGGVGSSRSGNSNSTTTQSLTSLSGGIASQPAEGDLVLVVCVVGSQGRNADQSISGYTTIGTQLNSASATYDTSLQVSYKFMTSTPDTSITIPAQGNIADGQAWEVMVFRGVSTSGPFDVTSTNAIGINNTAFNAPAITPTTAGSWIVIAGGGAYSAGVVYTAPTDFDSADWLSHNGADTNDGTAGMGYYSGWTSGSYNPASVGGGASSATASWAAWTMALKPSPPAATQTGVPTITSPQSPAGPGVAGFAAAVFAVGAALFPPPTPPRPVFIKTQEELRLNFQSSVFETLIQQFIPPVSAAEYQHGTHQASIHDQSIRGSQSFKYPHEGMAVVEVTPGKFLRVDPQIAQNLSASLYRTHQNLQRPPVRSQTWIGPQEPETRQSRVYSNLIKQTDLLERNRLTWTLPQPYDVQQSQTYRAHYQAPTDPFVLPRTFTLPQPFDVQQGNVYHTLIQQFISPPNRSRTFTLPQPYDVQQGQVYETLIQSFISPPNRPKTFTTPQPFDIQQGRVDHTLIQQFVRPPNRFYVRNDQQVPEQVFSAVFEAWQHVAVQSPPLRPYIITSAETPWNVSPHFKGDTSQYAPAQPLPAGSEYHYGSHQARIFDSQNPSKVFYHKVYAAPQNPPNRPYIQTLPQVPLYNISRVESKAPYLPPAPPTIPDHWPSGWEYQHGTHQLHTLQQGNRPTFFPGWGVRVIEFYFISQYVVGERDNPPDNIQPVIWKQRPAEGTPYVEPKLIHPTYSTQESQNYRASNVFHPWLDASARIIGGTKITTTPDPQEYNPRNDSSVWHHPPRTVESPKHYWPILTFPQMDQTIRPSALFTRKDLPSVPSVERTLAGFEITFYPGTVTPQRRKHVGRIVTEPKYLGEIAELSPPFNFSNWMDAGETILTQTVTASVYSGADPSPSTIRSGAPWVENRTEVHQMMRGGVLGCVYELLCEVTTSAGQILQQTTYFYIEPDLP